MRLKLEKLQITFRKSVEELRFSRSVTFLYGPVGTGKSTVARLVDYCLGGDLERTPAVRQEFVAVQLNLRIGQYSCTLERSATDTQSVRVSWSREQLKDVGDDSGDRRDDEAATEELIETESVNAPLDATDEPIFGEDVYNLSDLLFHLSGVRPIKVRQRVRDPDSPMIRLSFRDIWWYCYLEQTHLDSSFFKLEEPFKGRKSQDAMRFFTGLHSERLSQLEADLYRGIDEQKGKREAANQIKIFMSRFELGTELDVGSRIEAARRDLETANSQRREIERDREVILHPTDQLRTRLRELSSEVAALESSIEDTASAISQQRALKAELITAKVKASRAEQAAVVLSGVSYERCPQCSSDISARPHVVGACSLCCSNLRKTEHVPSLELESMRRELNDRIDLIGDSIQRRERALEKGQRLLERLRVEKSKADSLLQDELARYDSAFIEKIRSIDRHQATLVERIKSLEKLREMPKAIAELEDQAAELQAKIERIREAVDLEVGRLKRADGNVAAIADRFRTILIAVGFPGVSADDTVELDPRTWKPTIHHRGQEWTFWDAGSGGKKTLFNVCYALAVHEVALERNLPVPNLLVIDSPTKNISDDENPELVESLYHQIYRLASMREGEIQFLLIDSDLVMPQDGALDFRHEHLAGETEAPSLIPYYTGP
ncbi:DUF3732 domain-containing protein [Pseudoxanthomonas sp. SE1]|uniref:DUF3732 domain-containing protein n=1 Tax=Pseudoxanthomonas sp. SE1 TaxID=1664560 RepID=UPI00240D3DAC|nr:DUF3732 domain-containing protein [Pseudoxanthomonas sp. SE1]WFC42283.1 AAA family ATPase [Pseudoxanthomonas sp. SE1]